LFARRKKEKLDTAVVRQDNAKRFVAAGVSLDGLYNKRVGSLAGRRQNQIKAKAGGGEAEASVRQSRARRPEEPEAKRGTMKRGDGGFGGDELREGQEKGRRGERPEISRQVCNRGTSSMYLVVAADAGCGQKPVPRYGPRRRSGRWLDRGWSVRLGWIGAGADMCW
jgi:hypothetical protein